MDEDGAAAACYAWTRIVINFDDEIIEIVRTRQPVRICVGRNFDRSIVSAVGRVFAPGIGRAYSLHRQRGGGPRMLVGAPPKLPWLKNTAWRATIAFAFVG